MNNCRGSRLTKGSVPFLPLYRAPVPYMLTPPPVSSRAVLPNLPSNAGSSNPFPGKFSANSHPVGAAAPPRKSAYRVLRSSLLKEDLLQTPGRSERHTEMAKPQAVWSHGGHTGSRKTGFMGTRPGSDRRFSHPCVIYEDSVFRVFGRFSLCHES